MTEEQPLRPEEVPAFWDVGGTTRPQGDERGIEDLEDLHERFVATEYADLRTPGRKRGTRLSLYEFRKHLVGNPPGYCGEVPRGLAEIFGFVGEKQEAQLALSYLFGRASTRPLQ